MKISYVESSRKNKMSEIRIAFTDFWTTFDPKDSFIVKEILEGLNILIVDSNPHILFYGPFGNRHKQFQDTRKIYWSGENTRPNYEECDLALSFELDSTKNVHCPLFAIDYWYALDRNYTSHSNPSELLTKSKDVSKRPEKFISFVHGNGFVGTNHWGNYQDGVKKRNELFDILSKYKKVDSAGTFRNNMPYTVTGGPVKGKFIRDYKFTFAIENSSSPENVSYVTEKMIDPMLFGSIPVHWGSKYVEDYFNPKSFINANNFSNNHDLADYLIYLDQNDQAYNEIYEQPFVTGGNLPEVFNLKRIQSRILNLL